MGGLLCLIAQLLIDYTSLTPARILCSYVVAAVVLEALGLYGWIFDLAGAGISVPLTGFGSLLATGVREAVDEKGLLGVFTGGIAACSAGISGALVLSLLAALIFRPKPKEL